MKHDLTHALMALRPGSQWSLNGDSYSGLNWMSEGPAPTLEELTAKIAELDAAEPMKLLRIERDKRLADSDWVVVRSVSTGEALSKEWKKYLQDLRDLPATAEPKLDEVGRLDDSSVDWPVKP